jgi:hypothetical protein
MFLFFYEANYVVQNNEDLTLMHIKDLNDENMGLCNQWQQTWLEDGTFYIYYTENLVGKKDFPFNDKNQKIYLDYNYANFHLLQISSKESQYWQKCKYVGNIIRTFMVNPGIFNINTKYPDDPYLELIDDCSRDNKKISDEQLIQEYEENMYNKVCLTESLDGNTSYFLK